MMKALHWLKKSGVAVANLSFSGPRTTCCITECGS